MARKLLLLLLLTPFLVFGRPLTERPLIGVSCGCSKGTSVVKNNYSEAISKAGGVPILIPVTSDSLALRGVLRRLDGIIMSGGEDIAPAYYGEEPHERLGVVNDSRDTYDIMVARMAHDMNIPMLGICRGVQLINVVFGGTLYQDIPTQCPTWTLTHRNRAKDEEPPHIVHFEADSQLARMFGVTELETNSHHHQAVKRVAPGFRIVARASDSTPEAIESIEEYPIWGVQFHPEIMLARGNEAALCLFKAFVGKADTYRRAKRIHEKCLSIDSHTDAPLKFKDNYNFAERTPHQVNLPKMEEGMLDGQYLASWVRQQECTKEGAERAVERVNLLLERTLKQVEMNSDRLELARTPEDLARIKAAGKKAVFLAVENAYGIGSLADFERLHKLGVTYVTLCHSRNNDYCDSSSDKKTRWEGLSPLGRKAVKEMNRLGIMVDISHASEATFWDVLRSSTKPVIASHSLSKVLYDHNRNLTDEQLRALAKKGGVAQATLVGFFLKKKTSDMKSGSVEASLSDFVKHILHMIKVAGIDHVGIGTDFDGGGGVKGCNGDNDLINITVRLLEEGLSESDIAKIWGGNFLRVMKEVQSK